MESSDASYSQARADFIAFIDQQTANTRAKSSIVVRCLSRQVRQEALLLSKEKTTKLISPMGFPLIWNAHETNMIGKSINIT